MGLDLVELVMEVEEEFNIALPDADMEKIRTPNDLAEYIFTHFHTPKKEKCSSQVAFYTLRKLLIDNFGYKREELTPTTNLQKLLGEDIRSKWKKLDNLFENKIYDNTLTLRKKENILFYMISLGVFIGLYFVTQLFGESLVAIAIIMAISHTYLTKYFGTQLAYRYTELSSLLRYIDKNRLEIYDSQKRVLEKVIAISADSLGIPISEIHPNSLYVEDLGAG